MQEQSEPSYARGLGIALIAVAMLAPQWGTADIDFDANGKHYRLVTTAATWAAAKTAAFAATHNASPGHLATIESEAENAAIFARLDPSNNADVEAAMPWGSYAHSDSFARSVWLGAADDAAQVTGSSEGNFFWMGDTLAAATAQFWQGGKGGSAVAGRYENWGYAGEEPDDWGAGQDSVGMQIDAWPYGIAGEWNDLNGAQPQAYLIEFEGTPVEPPELQRPALDGTTNAAISWSSQSNILYTVHSATNLTTGFISVEHDIEATPPMNTYTDTVDGVMMKFWKVTTQ